jgi:hypothetical protein
MGLVLDAVLVADDVMRDVQWYRMYGYSDGMKLCRLRGEARTG